MTTLYKPVLIESAEQAEALPYDAIVIGVETGERYTRTYDGEWWGVTDMGTRLEVDLHVGDTVQALVPIEAEEEVEAASHVMGKLTASGVEFTESTGDVASWQRRYVTPWVEDDLPDGWESFTVGGEEA